MRWIIKHQAFVLGLFDTGLAVIRSLGKCGVPVTGLDYNPRMPGFRSRYCTARLLPNPIHQPEETLDFLLNEGKKLAEQGILFPTTDAFVLFVSRYRDALKEHYRFDLPSRDIVESIVNKKKQYELAQSINTPIPQTYYPKGLQDIERIAEIADYPVFVKPCITYKWQEKFPLVKGFQALCPVELNNLLKNVIPQELEVIVQGIVSGPNTNHYKVSTYIDRSGDVRATFTLQKIRQYPTEFGVGSCVESVHYNELKELGLTFFKGINYRGVGSVEFKKDERDGKLKMIELNPRYWQQNMLATVCGINFPMIQYLSLTAQDPGFHDEFEAGVKWLDPVADFQAFWDYFKKNELSFNQWFKSLKGIKAFATFTPDDPGPFFKNIEYGLKILKMPLYMLKQRRVKC